MADSVEPLILGVFMSDLMRYAGPRHVAQNNNVLFALTAWAWAENTEAVFNPLATTEPWTGATDFNSDRVKNYPNGIVGVAATWRTLTNGYYPRVLAELLAGTSSEAIAEAVAASPWGTEPFAPLCAAVASDWLKYGYRVVAGS